jgi:Lhr-like helicase
MDGSENTGRHEDRFQEGRYQVLVSTDIASRGLHVDDVAHVINYDVPKVAEDFIHRVGRTGLLPAMRSKCVRLACFEPCALVDLPSPCPSADAPSLT